MKNIEEVKQMEQVYSELAIFWELIASYLPKTVERNALGDNKIFIAFKAAYPKIKEHIHNQAIDKAIEALGEDEDNPVSSKNYYLYKSREELEKLKIDTMSDAEACKLDQEMWGGRGKA